MNAVPTDVESKGIEDETVHNDHALHLLTFKVGEQVLAMRSDAIARIIPMMTFTRAVTGLSILAGFLNLGGSAVPVLRTSRLLEMPPCDFRLYTPLIVLRRPKGAVALLVDYVYELITVHSAQLVPLPQQFLAQGTISQNGQNIVVLCPDRLLNEEERRRIEELRSQEESRLLELEQCSV